ncbi:myb-related transcription factor, partner of profilin-like [Sardina pilchardus]|uniref:myb-related transcription factor, partner of profilin-like n=1 Tax=Sardina pilchardus TaxID=27697 RepID=UPI002E103D5F
MEETRSKRKKRAPSFTAEEVTVLVDEVLQYRDVLFGGTREQKNIEVKNRVWQAIAESMSPYSPCGLRDWVAVRKKWQEFQSLTKKKSEKLMRDSMGTDGGASGGTTLTPDEEKVLSIMGKTASEGINVVVVEGDDGLLESENDEEQSGSGAGTSTPPGDDDPPHPCPVPVRQAAVAGPGVRIWGGLTGRPAITTCACSETLVRLEREKLVVLRGIEDQLQRQNALQEEMVRIKQERLELHRRQLMLAEAQSLHLDSNHSSPGFR